MPVNVSRRKMLDVLTLVASGHTKAHAARLTHISKSTVARSKKKQRLYGDIEGGKKKIVVKPRKEPR
jgi:hypothetical protein